MKTQKQSQTGLVTIVMATTSEAEARGAAKGWSSSLELPAGPTRSFPCLLEHRLWMTGMM